MLGGQKTYQCFILVFLLVSVTACCGARKPRKPGKTKTSLFHSIESKTHIDRVGDFVSTAVKGPGGVKGVLEEGAIRLGESVVEEAVEPTGCCGGRKSRKSVAKRDAKRPPKKTDQQLLVEKRRYEIAKANKALKAVQAKEEERNRLKAEELRKLEAEREKKQKDSELRQMVQRAIAAQLSQTTSKHAAIAAQTAADEAVQITNNLHEKIESSLAKTSNPLAIFTLISETSDIDFVKMVKAVARAENYDTLDCIGFVHFHH